MYEDRQDMKRREENNPFVRSTREGDEECASSRVAVARWLGKSLTIYVLAN